eukprot:TRINITY_DN19396_c0_g1_i1.p1 TRINITY_DN19396_c0_g1~~TRINITY_DN19396_c0_g1_i1.p1  ORF type:complete len:140 (-),score=27.64 TRINITY_DN19396_c0_g1_i1:87-482(-)
MGVHLSERQASQTSTVQQSLKQPSTSSMFRLSQTPPMHPRFQPICTATSSPTHSGCCWTGPPGGSSGGAFMAGSVTPVVWGKNRVVGVNPTIRLMEYNDVDAKVMDYKEYSLDIIKAAKNETVIVMITSYH